MKRPDIDHLFIIGLLFLILANVTHGIPSAMTAGMGVLYCVWSIVERFKATKAAK